MHWICNLQYAQHSQLPEYAELAISRELNIYNLQNLQGPEETELANSRMYMICKY